MALIDNCDIYYKLDGNSNDAVGSNNGTDTDISYGVENLTGYTEVDASSHITISASTTTFTNVDHNEYPYVYKDFGIGYFASSFTHTFQFKNTPQSGSSGVWIWELANNVECASDGYAAGHQSVAIRYYGNVLYITEQYAGPSQVNSSNYYIYTNNTDYYIKVVYNSAVGTHGTVYCYIYSDSAMTNLLNTDSLALAITPSYRYLYTFSNFGSGNTNEKSTGYTKNFVLSSQSYGKINQGAGFNGTTSKINLGNASSLKLAHTGSYNFWAKSNSQLSDTWYVPLDYHNWSTDLGGYGIKFQNGGGGLYYIEADLGDASSYQILIGNSGYFFDTTTTAWQMFTVTWDGTNFKIYKNGVEANTASQTVDSLCNASYSLLFGQANVAGTTPFPGAIDEVGIWSRALSSTEVTALYNSGAGLAYPFSTTAIKSWNGLAIASVKKINGLAIASVKKINGLA